jgi:predicted MFS family arabinose efflux permease
MAYAAGLIISSPFVAILGELCDSRRTPLLGCLAFMAAATVLFMETASYPAMIVARILQGISATGVWTLGLALVFDSVPEERMGVVLG